MREWEGDASLSRIGGCHCRQLLLLRQGWHCPLLVICHLRIKRERGGKRGKERGVVTVMPNQRVPTSTHGMFTCRKGDDTEPTWQQGYGPSAYIHLASETSYYWSRSPTLTLVTMEAFANSYHAGYRPGGRWYWTYNKDMGLYTGLDTPLPFSLPHTHMQAYKL